MHVAIVCGYGLFDSEVRTSTEMDGLEEYFHSSIQDISVRGIQNVVLCGGYTNPQRPLLSEAKSVANWLSHRRNSQQVRFFLEERSGNAVQNIYFAIDLFREEGIPVSRVTIYCDEIRTWKIHVIACSALRDSHIPFEIVGFPRRDIHPNSKRWKQRLQAIKLMLHPGTIQADLNVPPALPPSL